MRITAGLLGLGLGLGLLGGAAFAQQAPAPRPGAASPGPSASGLTQPGAMDRLLERIEAARRSNDPAQMRAALDQAAGALSMVREHMRMCEGMMGQPMPGHSPMHRMPGASPRP